jgi:regulatory protein
LVITKIEKQRKNSRRISLYIDGEFACGLYEDTLVKYGLRTGDEISKEILNEIINFDEYLYAKKSAFDLLSYRLRSIREIKDKLKAKKISSKTVERTLKHLKDLGLLNDDEFARQLILSNISSRPKGKGVIKQKLYQKGISKQVSEKILNEVFENIDEKKIAIDVFEKYSKKLKTDNNIQKKRKIFSYLARKGFDFDIINEIIHEKIN